MELVAVSDEHPLHTVRHFVGGAAVLAPEAAVAVTADDFESTYASLGVAVWTSVLDGDCAFDVMLVMLGKPSDYTARKNLRSVISD